MEHIQKDPVNMTNIPLNLARGLDCCSCQNNYNTVVRKKQEYSELRWKWEKVEAINECDFFRI